jgi:hypothetical protein
VIKIVLYILLFFGLPFHILAQTGIAIGSNTPDASSLLDVTSTDKGILIPRISIPDANAAAPVASPATGLLVFNTNASISNGSGSGFYYWNTTNWTKLANGAGDADWFVENSTNVPTSINDNIYTNGNVGIGVPLPLMSLHTSGDIQVGGDNIYNDQTGSGQNLNILSVGGVSIVLDNNSNGSEEFSIKSGSAVSTNVFEITEAGNWQSDGDGVISGNDLAFDGAANANIITASTNTSLSLDIESQGGLDLVLDRDNDNPSAEFAIKRNADGTAAVNKLLSIPEDDSPLFYPYGIASGQTAGIRMRELEANGTNNIGIRAPDALSANVMLTLPTTDGNANELLQTDGAGNLSWYNKDNIAVVKRQVAYNAVESSFSSTWSKAPLNTLETTGTFISLSGNDFTLATGKYSIVSVSPAFQLTAPSTRIYKTRLIDSGGTVYAQGSIGNSFGINYMTQSHLHTVINIASSTTFSIEQLASDVMYNYLSGLPSTFGDQVYTQITIIKIE